MSLIGKVEPILDFVRLQTQAQNIELIQFEQLSGGAIQDNYGLKVNMTGGSMPGMQSFVVRSDAPSSLDVSLSREHEFAVISLAYQNGVKVPKPYWLCTDLNVIGQQFYIMQWVSGSASAHALVRDDALSPEQRQNLSFSLGQEIAKLHEIKYSDQVLPFLRAPQDNAAQQRIEEYQAALDKLPSPEPVIELGLQVLKQLKPETSTWVLSHCDYRTGNYMVDNGELTAILDWEFTNWSDYYEDLGWLCARSWRFGQNDRGAGGVGQKEDFFTGYEKISGKTIDPRLVKYWELMASVRWAIIALEQAQRFISNGEQSIELALTGRMAPEINLDLMLHIFDVLNISIDLSALTTDLDNIKIDVVNNYNDQPYGADLLNIARKTLFNNILPELPKGLSYDARMIASAISMVERELNIGGPVNQQIDQLVNDFYSDEAKLGALDLKRLSNDIRTGAKTYNQELFNLLLKILFLKLQITNPKRLAKI